MSKSFFSRCVAIACTAFLSKAAIALPLPSLQTGSVVRLDANAPLCYIQFQGRSAIDVTQVCGKKPGAVPHETAINSISGATAPPVFDPKETNASTTGQCNFVDANGNPCPPGRE